MIKSLLRLGVFVRPYRIRLSVGVIAFGIARVFEGLIPLCLALAIDRIAEGNQDVLFPVLGIFAAVIGRYLLVTFARFAVRRTGLNVAFDLRQALYASLQLQGLKFFNQYTIGDMMTRAVADISLIQRLISMGTILFVILFFATVVGFGFMLIPKKCSQIEKEC